MIGLAACSGTVPRDLILTSGHEAGASKESSCLRANPENFLRGPLAPAPRHEVVIGISSASPLGHRSPRRMHTGAGLRAGSLHVEQAGEQEEALDQQQREDDGRRRGIAVDPGSSWHRFRHADSPNPATEMVATSRDASWQPELCAPSPGGRGDIAPAKVQPKW